MWTAAVSSFSAFSTHSRRTVRAASSGTGIQPLPFPEGRPFNRADDILPPREVLRLCYQHIYGHGDVVHRPLKLHHLVRLRPRESHHHEQINIAVRPGVATGLRAEQDDSLRAKSLHDPLDHAVDEGLDVRLLRGSWHSEPPSRSLEP